MTCVSQILDLSSPLKNTTEPAFLDTYANLLYKSGKKNEALCGSRKLLTPAPKMNGLVTSQRSTK